MRAFEVLNYVEKGGFLGTGTLPKKSTRFATDVAVKLSLGEKGPNSCFWW
jgi:hypothetical protein